MKTYWLCIVFAAALACPAQEPSGNVAQCLDLVQANLSTTRSNISAAITLQIGDGVVSLPSLITALNQAGEALASAQIEKKLGVAQEMVEAARTQLVSLKTAEQELDMDFALIDGIVRRIALLKAQEAQLRREIESLRGEMEKLRAWSNLMEPVLAADQLSQRLKKSLRGLLPQLPPQAWPKTSTAKLEVGGQGKGKIETSLPGPLMGGLSPSALELLELSRKGVPEAALLAWVARAPARYDLTSDQLTSFHKEGLSPAVLAAMLRHDRALEDQESQVEVPRGEAAQKRRPPAFRTR